LSDRTEPVRDILGAITFTPTLNRWRPVARAIDAIADVAGASRLYPFAPAGAVVDKLEFVHARITAHVDRGLFYDESVGSHHA
jgi:hypothetical protein